MEQAFLKAQFLPVRFDSQVDNAFLQDIPCVSLHGAYWYFCGIRNLFIVVSVYHESKYPKIQIIDYSINAVLLMSVLLLTWEVFNLPTLITIHNIVFASYKLCYSHT